MKKILLIILSIILLAAVGTIFYFQKKLANDTRTSDNYFFKLLSQTYSRPTINQNFNFVILGLDRRDDWLEKTETTDTIIFANFDFVGNKLNLIPLPRDLWSYSLNKKINQIFPLSEQQADKYGFIQKNFSEITGQKVDKTVILTTANLSRLIQIINGVDVYLEKGFEDDKYPNPDYIKNPSPKTPIYTTIKFPAGWNHLDENNITQFVRSRKSAETAAQGGTDIGRIQRQEVLFDAIFKKISSADLISYSRLINLYNFWRYDLQTNLSDSDLVSILLIKKRDILNLKINKSNIPTGENPKSDIIYHPQKFINSQWVFIPQDKEYQSLHQFISKSIGQ